VRRENLVSGQGPLNINFFDLVVDRMFSSLDLGAQGRLLCSGTSLKF
jgi:hypothetical protein